MKRTPAFVATLKNVKSQLDRLNSIRNSLKGTPFRLGLMGRGSRKHLYDTYKGPFGGCGPHTLQSFIPLKYAEMVDVYVKVRTNYRVRSNGVIDFLPLRVKEVNALARKFRKMVVLNV